MRNNQSRLTEAELVPRLRLESVLKPEHNYNMSINIYIMLAGCIKKEMDYISKNGGDPYDHSTILCYKSEFSLKSLNVQTFYAT